MAQKLKHQQSEGGGDSNVLVLNRCIAQGCSKKAELMTFCKEHYEWFKFGLITKKGERPSDFDKKYMAFKKRKAA